MARMQGMAAFAETVRQGSFAAAARELGLTPSAVAKSVARLEADLGLRLLHRTTRQVSLTSDGHDIFERCRRIVDELDALRADAEGVRGEPSGTLRLNAPVTFGRKVLMPQLARLVARHPRIALDVTFSDRFADLVKEGFDAAVRIGHSARFHAGRAADRTAAPRRVRESGVSRKRGATREAGRALRPPLHRVSHAVDRPRPAVGIRRGRAAARVHAAVGGDDERRRGAGGRPRSRAWGSCRCPISWRTTTCAPDGSSKC